MSLDVYLNVKTAIKKDTSGIFVRQNGSTKEISLEEWNRLNPGCEVVVVVNKPQESTEVFSANITHNLHKMASEAGVYECCWRPDEHGIKTANQLIEPLKAGIANLRSDPERFRNFNPSNGWGTYEGLIEWLEAYLAACIAYPEAEVSVWR